MKLEKTLAHYRIIEKLGEGGMGQVYAAEDVRLERKTALKVLSPEFAADPGRLARFVREAKTVASLNHPNIVTIYSVEQAGDVKFLTMELVEGRTLASVMSNVKLTLDQFFNICLPLTDALSAAHVRGIMHRDLKPANIMINNEGRVKVLDFGLAKLIDQPASYAGMSSVNTEEGRILGTVPYMSPEQLKGLEADHRSDIFSLGVVLYEMATGQRPFRGNTSVERITSILRDEPRPITEFNAALPRQLSRIIRLCLEKEPGERFQSAIDVRNQLRSLKRELEVTEALSSGEAGVAVDTSAERWSRPAIDFPRGLPGMLSTKLGLTLLLAALFTVNWIETTLEHGIKTTFDVGRDLAHDLARAVHWLEGGLVFENHDATNLLAVYGHSVSYFFLFPALALGTGLALLRRREIRPFRIFSLATATAYALSLPFFVFFPVPERWSYPNSGATLLSDLWTSKLIETIRPISGLDNCFPSFHVSLTVIVILVGYLFRVRMRTTVLVLGATVILATFVLGIHWLADIVAGTAVGTVSVSLARRIDRAVRGQVLA